MQRNTLSIQRRQILHDTVIHLLLCRAETYRNDSLNRFCNVREAFNHRATNADTSDKCLKLIFLVRLDTHDLLVTSYEVLFAEVIAECPVTSPTHDFSMRTVLTTTVREVKQTPDFSGIVHESSSSHHKLVSRL